MSDWTEGYVADVDCYYGFQSELNPGRIPLALLNAGFAAPQVGIACELGFGQGLSVNLHAAASKVQWYGTDFSASQADFARHLAAASGSGAQLFDQSFAEFCARTDLPDFDYICMHGVWSWISEDNRRTLVDFLRRKLKLGGVLYVGYNVQPGFAALLPLQGILSRHAEGMGLAAAGAAPDVGTRVRTALDFVEKAVNLSPGYARAHPFILEQLRTLQGNDPHYLAHEYFNKDWAPTPFSAMADMLAPAKIEFACSANHFNSVDAWNLRADQRAFLKQIPDYRLRQTVRDLMMQQTFRRDYWIKGARRLPPLEALELALQQRVVLTHPRDHAPLKAVGAIGEFPLMDSLCAPILDALSDHTPKYLAQIDRQVRPKGIAPQQLVDIVLTLIRIGLIAPAQEDSIIAASRRQTDRLNACLRDKARTGTDLNVQASPVTGGGVIGVGGRIILYFMHAITTGKSTAPELAAHVHLIFQSLGTSILKAGQPVESPEEGRSILEAQAEYFIARQLPLLKVLQIA